MFVRICSKFWREFLKVPWHVSETSELYFKKVHFQLAYFEYLCWPMSSWSKRLNPGTQMLPRSLNAGPIVLENVTTGRHKGHMPLLLRFWSEASLRIEARLSLHSKAIARQWPRHAGQQDRPPLCGLNAVRGQSTEQPMQAVLSQTSPWFCPSAAAGLLCWVKPRIEILSCLWEKSATWEQNNRTEELEKRKQNRKEGLCRSPTRSHPWVEKSAAEQACFSSIQLRGLRYLITSSRDCYILAWIWTHKNWNIFYTSHVF